MVRISGSAPDSITPTGPAGGDLQGSYPSPVVDGIAGDAVIQYDSTIYVDPVGDAGNDGTNPATPTTLANAIASAGPSTNIVLADGTYTTGGAITIPADDITLSARTGGTQGMSVVIQDQIVLGAGRTRFRAFGIQFDGGVDDDSDGRHYFGSCSAGGGTYDRANPQNFLIWTNCDFSLLTYTSSGTGTGASLVVDGGASSLGPFTNGASGSLVEIHDATTQRITMTAGTVELRGAQVIDATLGISASAGTTVRAYNTQFETAAGAPIPITVDSYSLADVVFDPSTSTLGTPLGGLSEFDPGIRRHAERLASDDGLALVSTMAAPPGVVLLTIDDGAGGFVPISAGDYEVRVSIFVEVTNVNTQVWVALFEDTGGGYVQVGDPVLKPIGAANAGDNLTAIGVFHVPSPTGIKFRINIALGAGAGTVSTNRYYGALYRVT